jgi:uncharacterized protein YkwD
MDRTAVAMSTHKLMPKALKGSLRRIAIVILLMLGATSVRSRSRLMAASAGEDGSPGEPAQGATLTPATATSPDIPFRNYDLEAEHLLLDLANQARAQAGAPALTLDAGLSRAARAHAQAMFAARQLSHQFKGEPSLPQRLLAATRIQLDQEGENVALDLDAGQAQQHLMHSPPHRANLLNPAYNVIGLGVVRGGDQLYVVQDFGHALPNYSASEIKDRVAATLSQARHHANQPDLARQDLSTVDDAACSMAQADKLTTAAVHQLAQRSTVLTYSGLHPETLPANAPHALAGRNLRGFSVGACYARTRTYPAGTYWVVLSLE